MPGGEPTEGGYKARAGALTLLYISSQVGREGLLARLAEAATGVKLEEVEPPVEDPLHMNIFSDPYLFEPADPNHPPGAPIDDDTVLRPTPAGREVPFVGAALADWLRRCPAGPLTLAKGPGQEISALLYGWASMVTHALCDGPLTLEQVDDAVQADLGLVDELIDLMEETGLLEEANSDKPDEEPRVRVTEWLRHSVTPIAAAARMELRHPPGDTAPIAARDVEAAFQLALPLLKLPRKLSGTCSLAVELAEGVADSPAAVTARIEEGRVVACEPGFDEDADASASATAAEWLETVIERKANLVPTAGDDKLATALLHELHNTLFGSVRAPR